MRCLPFRTMKSAVVRGSRIGSFQGARFCGIATHFSKRSASFASFMISWTRVHDSSPSISFSSSETSYCATGSPALEREGVRKFPKGTHLVRVGRRELHRAAPHGEDGLRHVFLRED